MFRGLKDLMQDVGSGPRVAKELRAVRSGAGTDFLQEHRHAAQQEYVERLHPPQMQLRVEEVVQETPTTRTFRTRRVDGELPPFRAGQYVNLYVDVDGVRTSRPYSISSPPGAPHLDLTVRDVPGGFVAPHLLASVSAGDELRCSGPEGCFYYESLNHGRELVLLAGGSGITPFASMLREMAAAGWPCRVWLLYGCRTPDDVIFGDELRQMAKDADRFDLAVVISEPPEGYRGKRGLLDAKRIRREVGSVRGKTLYVCGPGAMYDFCLPQLDELGVPRHRVKRELYGPPADVTRVPGWPEGVAAGATFTVHIGDRAIEAAADEPLLCSLERHGLAPPSICRSGECSLCRTRLLDGDVFIPPGAGIREADRRHGYIHPCVTYPISDITIRI